MKYSIEQMKKAVELYIKYFHNASSVIHELGYPNRHALAVGVSRDDYY